MGGTSGTTTPAGQTSTGNATINNPQLNWPEWATNLAAQQPASPMAPAGSTAAGAGDPVADLGFPSPTATPSAIEGSMAPTGFSSEPYGASDAFGGVPDGTDPIHLGAGMTAPVDPAADAGLPATGPDAPITQAQLQAQLGQPRNPVYEDTQVSAYTLPGGTYGTTGVQYGTPGSTYPNGVGYVDPKAYETFGAGQGPYMDPRMDPYYAASSGKPALTPGTVLTADQLASQPHMSQALYDFNMNAYGNPYGPQQASSDKALYDRLLAMYGPQSASMMALGGGGNYGGGA